MNEHVKPTGLVRRVNRGGGFRLYWCAKNVSRKAARYPEGNVRIPDGATEEEIAAICESNNQRLRRWIDIRENLRIKAGALSVKEYDATFVNATEVAELGSISPEGRPGYVYFIGDRKHVKIGFTSQLKKRMIELQISVPNQVRHYLLIVGTEAHEAALHSLFYQDHHRGEWYKITKRVKFFMERHRANRPIEYFENIATEKVRTLSCQVMSYSEKNQQIQRWNGRGSRI